MIVYAQPGYAVDWDWSQEFGVWSTHPDNADRLVATHHLDRTPRSEQQAAAIARRWWLRQGRAEVQRQHESETTDGT